MSTFDLDNNSAAFQIRGHGHGFIKINDTRYRQSLILTNGHLIENWPVRSAEECTTESLAPVLALKPTILLIGTGRAHCFLPLAVYADLLKQGIGVEVMSTPAACRTFNALTAENRNVAAALITP